MGTRSLKCRHRSSAHFSTRTPLGDRVGLGCCGWPLGEKWNACRMTHHPCWHRDLRASCRIDAQSSARTGCRLVKSKASGIQKPFILPPNLDLWESVSFADLPAELVSAFERQDWVKLKDELRTVMDSVTTDGVYGRELLQLVRKIPLGVDPVFNRYRAAAAVDHGDWDDLRVSLSTDPVGVEELQGLRDIWLAPLDRSTPPKAKETHHAFVFDLVELEHQRAYGALRRYARRMPQFTFTEVVWSREDIPATRHFLYRRLLDAVFLAIGEAYGGRLEVAEGLAREAQALGAEREPLRTFARDLETLIGYARGESDRAELHWPASVTQPTGSSPVGAWQMTAHLLPLMSLLEDGSLGWCARLTERVAARMGSPRALLYATSWRLASDLLANGNPPYAELSSLLVQARAAVPGLRILPLLLYGYATRRFSAFADAFDLSRRAGNVWMQLSALAWMAASDPTPWIVRSLHRLLEVSGWRRIALVPSQIAADAALAAAASGLRGVGIVQLALLAGRANVTVDVASRHLDDSATPAAARIAAVQALGKLATVRSREILERLLRRKDELSELSRVLLTRPSTAVTLSEREAEVLSLVGHGLTNREIGARLGLSEHTVARHIANARNKLGAANRSEAVSRLRELSLDT